MPVLLAATDLRPVRARRHPDVSSVVHDIEIQGRGHGRRGAHTDLGAVLPQSLVFHGLDHPKGAGGLARVAERLAV